MKSIKQRVEENVVIWLLGALLSGFLSGIAAYEAILRIANLKPIPAETISSSNRETKQKWIRLTDVQFQISTGSIEKYRVVMKVDGVPYSYPGSAIGKKAGTNIPAEDFPLRIGKNEYRVEFELVYLTSSGQEVRAAGHQPMRIIVFPFEGSYTVFNLAGGSSPTATISFHMFEK